MTASRTDHAFQLVVRAPLSRAFPLFGGWGERFWAGPSWQPRFVYPQPPRDEEGEVFTTARPDGEAVWVNTCFDLARGRVQYVYVVAGVQAVLIDLALKETGAAATQVTVRYRRTALAPEHNAHVEALGREDAASGPEWEAEVNAGLA